MLHLWERLETKLLTVVFATFVLSACAPVPVKHVLGTEGVSEQKLAVMEVMTNEVFLIEVDGKRDVPEATGFNIFLSEGPHRLVFRLNWVGTMCVGGACMPYSTGADSVKTACITADGGMIYHFYARNPGPNWELHVSRRKIGEDRGRDIDHVCK